MEALERLKPLALLLLRCALGVVFIHHGYPKLFTQAHGTMEMFVKMGFPSYFGVIAGIVEFFGGCLLIAGLFARIAGLLIAGEMVIAMWRVHGAFSNPMAVQNFEFPMILAASAFAIACLGAGAISLDHAIYGSRGGGRSSRKARAPQRH